MKNSPLNSKLTYEEAQAAIYSLIEAVSGKEVDCGDEWANKIASEFLRNFKYPTQPTADWQKDSAKFRKRWLELFHDATEEELLILDNCAGLRLLKEDDGEVTFWTDGHGIGFDKQTSIEVIVKLPDPLASAIVWQQRDDKIQLWKDHGSGAGGGRECVDEFTDSDELAVWFQDQIER